MSDTTSLLGQLVEISRNHFELHKNGGAQESKCIKIMTHVRRALPGLEERYLDPSQNRDEVARMLHLLDLLLSGKVCNRSTEDLFESGSLPAILPRIVRFVKLLANPAMSGLRSEIATVLEHCLRLQFHSTHAEARRQGEILGNDASSLLHDALVAGICVARGTAQIPSHGLTFRLFPRSTAACSGSGGHEPMEASSGLFKNCTVVVHAHSDQLRLLLASLQLTLGLTQAQVCPSVARVPFTQTSVNMLPAAVDHLAWHCRRLWDHHAKCSFEDDLACIEGILATILRILQRLQISTVGRRNLLRAIGTTVCEMSKILGCLQDGEEARGEGGGPMRRASRPVMSDDQRRQSQVRKQLSAKLQTFVSDASGALVQAICNATLYGSCAERLQVASAVGRSACQVLAGVKDRSKAGPVEHDCLRAFLSVLGWQLCSLLPSSRASQWRAAHEVEDPRMIPALTELLEYREDKKGRKRLAEAFLRPCLYGLVKDASMASIDVAVCTEQPALDTKSDPGAPPSSSVLPSFRITANSLEHTGVEDGLPYLLVQEIERAGRALLALASLPSREEMQIQKDASTNRILVVLTALLLRDTTLSHGSLTASLGEDDGRIQIVRLSDFLFRRFANTLLTQPFRRRFAGDLEAVVDLSLTSVLRWNGTTGGFSSIDDLRDAVLRVVEWSLEWASTESSRMHPTHAASRVATGRFAGVDVLSILAEPLSVKLGLVSLVGQVVGMDAAAFLSSRDEEMVLQCGPAGVAVGCLSFGLDVGFSNTVEDFVATASGRAIESVAESLSALATAMRRAETQELESSDCKAESLADARGRSSLWYFVILKVLDFARVKGDRLSNLRRRLRRLCNALRKRNDDGRNDDGRNYAALVLDELCSAPEGGETKSQTRAHLAIDDRALGFPQSRKDLPAMLFAAKGTPEGQVAVLGSLCMALRLDMNDAEPSRTMEALRHYCKAFQGLLQTWFLQDAKHCHDAFDTLRRELTDLDSGFFFCVSRYPETFLAALLEPMLTKGVLHIFAEHVANVQTPTLFLALVLPYVLPPLVLQDLKGAKPVSSAVDPGDGQPAFVATCAELALQECNAARRGGRLDRSLGGSEVTSSAPNGNHVILNAQEERLLECLNRPEARLGLNPVENNFMALRASDDLQLDHSVMRFVLLSEFAPNIVARCLLEAQDADKRAADVSDVQHATRLLSAFLEMMKKAVAHQAQDANLHDFLDLYQADTFRILVAAFGWQGGDRDNVRRALEILALISEETGANSEDGGLVTRGGVHAFFASVKRKRRKVSDGTSEHRSSVADKVESMMARHWLYIMNSLVTNDWQSRTALLRRSLMMSLREGVQLLGLESLVRFAPKVIGSCSTAMEDSRREVCAGAVAVLDVIVDRIQSEALVPLVGPMCIPLFALLLRDAAVPDEVPREPVKDALDVLSKLFQKLKAAEMIACVSDCLPLVPSGFAALGEVQALFESQHSLKSLPAEFSGVSKFLLGNVPVARQLALTRLEHLLRNRRNELRNLTICGETVDESVDNLVSLLLRLCAKTVTSSEEKSSILTLASCIGEIGAIDPARLVLGASSEVSDSTANSSEIISDGNLCQAPWHISVEDMALHVLESFVVKGLKSARSALEQDRFGVAIQGLLKCLGSSFNTSSKAARRRSKKRAAEREQHEGGDVPGPHAAEMPDELAKVLVDRGILETVAPYWSTKYEFIDRVSKKPPFYKYGLTFERWIGLWSRYLIARVSGPFKEVFRACTGVVRYSPDIALFLLPYLILDIWVFNEDKVSFEIGVIRREMIGVLERTRRNSRDGTSTVMAQAIFRLLDVLWSWVHRGGEGASSAKRRPLDRFGEPGFKSDWPKGRMHVRDQSMNCIGKLALAKAAFICSAYSRALKYYEMHVRDERLSNMKHFASSAGGGDDSQIDWSDGVNGQLPRLTQEEIAFLHCTLVQMDDPDAIDGLQSARRLADFSPREREHVAELAHQGSWEEALDLYEASLNNHSMRESSHGLVLPQRAKRLLRADSGATSEDDGYQDRVTTWEAHHGVLTSLLNLGHIETALQNYKGFAQKSRAMAVSSLPVALEAAWQLQKWDDLEFLLKSCGAPERAKKDGPASAFRIDGRLFSSWATHDRVKVLFSRAVLSLARWTQGLRAGGGALAELQAFQEHLDGTRLLVMQSLSAAAMESYERSYPLAVSLHMLRELEIGQETILRVHEDPIKSFSEFSDLHRRFELTRPSLGIRAPLLALRRAILDLTGRHGQMLESARTSTLTQAKIACYQRNFRVAQQELRWARQLGLPADELHLKEAKVLHAQGKVFDGLMHLEGSGFGVQTEAEKLRLQYGLGAGEEGGNGKAADQKPSERLTSAFRRKRAAKKLLYSTVWLTEAGLKHGNEILDRFDLAIEMQPSWPKAYFALARYYDLLLEARRREIEMQVSASGGTEGSLEAGLAGDLSLHGYVKAAMSNYARGLEVGSGGALKSKQLFQALPRLLTLWFEFSSLAAAVALSKPKGKKRHESRGAREKRQLSSALREGCNDIIAQSVPRVEGHLWYTAQAQLLSRVTHSSEDVAQIVVKILIKILKEHTLQAIWTIGALANSEHDERKVQGSRIVQAAARLLRNTGGECMQHVQALRDSSNLFRSFVKLASFLPSEVGNITASIGTGVRLENFIVPTQSALSVQFASQSGRRSADTVYEPFLDHAPRIRRFLPEVDVMRSKAKPKKIYCETDDGMLVKFLCKREEKGDLRKDSRLMEWSIVVNRLLNQDAEAAKRKLRLRTYAVICLNEECGLLEWVENTGCLRTQIEEAYKSQLNFRVPPFSAMRQAAEKLQSKHFHDVKALSHAFRRDIFRRFPPVLHKWFLDQFHEPGRWLEARTRYTRAAALWSAVGHCIGLGDRHGENILICLNTAELVHVDFDCIFDKGLHLKVPEVVPFRLTANMVDAMGLFGTAGVFRNVMSIVLSILRDHRETLLNVLEPFLRDPTVAWQRQGRAQSEIAEESPLVDSGRLQGDAARALRIVDERLRGIYNLGPFTHGPGSSSQAEESDSADRVPLSVPGQVDRLIKEATDTGNLSRMFVGWAPWM